MANTATNVSAGKPKVGGAIYRCADMTKTAPSSAVAALTDFTCLGYVSEDGLTNANSPESESIKAWGGDTVLTTQTGKEDTFSFTLIEVLNIDVLKAVYGTSNVSGSTLASGVAVTVDSDEPEEAIWVIDMIMRGGVKKRIVIPDGKISEMEEITYTDNEAVGYGITIQALADSNGMTHMEYLTTATS